MPTSVEAQGLTVDEAIQTALNQLGASRDRVEIQILHHPRGGFLGIGARRAKVRATLRQDAFRDGQEFDMAPRRRPARRRRGRGRGEGGSDDSGNRGGKGADATAAPQRDLRDADRTARGTKNAAAAEGAPKRGRRRRGGRSRSGRGSAAGQTANGGSSDNRAESDKPSRQVDRPKGASGTRRKDPAPSASGTSPSAAGKAVSESVTKAQARAVPDAVGEVGSKGAGATIAALSSPGAQAPSAADLETLRDQAGKLTAGLIGKMGFEATVEVGLHGREQPQVVVRVTSESEGMLIGRRGQTLDALEHILNRMIFAGETAGTTAVTLDIGGYRERRRHSLQDTATRFRDRALIEQRAVQISPLSMRDRRIVQEVLGDDRTVVLKVVGSGPYRRIQIRPAGMAEAPVSEAGSGAETEREHDDHLGSEES